MTAIEQCPMCGGPCQHDEWDVHDERGEVIQQTGVFCSACGYQSIDEDGDATVRHNIASRSVALVRECTQRACLRPTISGSDCGSCLVCEAKAIAEGES